MRFEREESCIGSGLTDITNNSSGFAPSGYQDATTMSVSKYVGGSVDFTASFTGRIWASY